MAKFDARTIILGFTGPIGSGCSYFAEYLPLIAPKYKYYKLSDFIREELIKEGKPAFTVDDMQNKGNELRFAKGANALIGMLFDKIDEEIKGKRKKEFAIVIDGIKNSAEVKTLRLFPHFFLISVQATTETRRQRSLDGKRFATGDEFDRADARDKSEDYEYGQQVSVCSYLSDIVIDNEENIPTVSRRGKIQEKYDKYIKLIECLYAGETALEEKPTIDELCMTIAYSLSECSNCLKRKVGAVVVDIEKAKQKDKEDVKTFSQENIQKEIPFIMSSGYNEVPLGQFPCLYNPDYQKCYRDYLQEEFAQKLKHCPSCGHKITLKKTTCPSCGTVHDSFVKSCNNCQKEIEYKLTCDNCKESIFDMYLPGSKHSPGKLLDMCKSLHAEEMCLLKLLKSVDDDESMVLYVTTQPCNLCANKIVLSGIKNVVYAEPYTLREAQDILDRGRVRTRRFEGIKSSAFFRLYR